MLAVSYTTAWHGLVDRGRLAAGETLLVLGAGGATGIAAVQPHSRTASAAAAKKRVLTLKGIARGGVGKHSARAG